VLDEDGFRQLSSYGGQPDAGMPRFNLRFAPVRLAEIIYLLTLAWRTAIRGFEYWGAYQAD